GRYGPISDQPMRNVVLAPDPIDGRYWALLRPNDDESAGSIGGKFREIVLASALTPYGPWTIDDGGPIMQTGHGPSFFQAKIGPGAPLVPITAEGRPWLLNLFHGVRQTMNAEGLYYLGV